MSTNVRPFLMFEGKAEEAMRFYVSLFSGGQILDIVRYGPGEAGPEGSVMRAKFSIGGQVLSCSDSYVTHAFTFTPSISFFVDCDTADALRHSGISPPRSPKEGKCSCRSATTASAESSPGWGIASASPGSSISPDRAIGQTGRGTFA